MAVSLSAEEQALWKKRIAAADADQKQYHPLWFEVLAFCQGHQWVKHTGATSMSRRLVEIKAKPGEQRYTVDELTQYRLTLAGELGADDDRPQVQFDQDEAPSEDYAEQANDALGYAWDEEALADEVLAEAKDTMIDLGTAPIRCKYDKDYGDWILDDQGEQKLFPFIDGKLVSTEEGIQAYDKGQKVQIRPMKEGRITWEAGTPFNVLVPPGVTREKDFKWLVWKSVSYLPDLKAKYPEAADKLMPDSIRSLATLSRPQEPSKADSPPASAENLGDHCFEFTAYQYPNAKYPKGRIVVFGSEKLVPLETFDTLSYQAPAGASRAGVYFLHAIRLTDRFWSRGFMELGLDPQRAINQHVTRIEQTIARGQPVRWIEEGTVKKFPDGVAGSIGWLKNNQGRMPQTDPGMGPGAWMRDAIVMQRENLARAILPDSALGDNPEGVETYSQLALLHSQLRKRLEKIVKQNKGVVVHLAEDTSWDIKTKWGPERQLKLAGDEGQLRAATFNASAWPDYYKVRFAKGIGLPRTQEAELKLIEDTYNAAATGGVTLQDPNGWLVWRVQSMRAGKMLDLPTPPVDAQRDKAQYENQVILKQPDVRFAVGLVDYFDAHAQHLPEHRSVQSHARLMGRNDVFIAMEAHCKEHERQQLLTTMQQIGTPGPTVPAMPGGGAEAVPQPQQPPMPAQPSNGSSGAKSRST